MTVALPESDAAPVRPALSPWMLIGGTLVCLCVGLLILGLVLYLLLGTTRVVHKPGIAEVQLPDQTWLVIEAVTFGQKHRLSMAKQQVFGWEVAPRGGQPTEFVHDTQEDALIVWMSHLSADNQRPLDPVWWTRSEVVDARGRVIKDDQPRRHLNLRSGSGNMGGTRPFNPLQTEMPHTRDIQQIVTSTQFPAIRARDGTFQLIVRDLEQAEVARFELKYPGQAPHTWKASPLPTKVTVDDLQVSVTALKTNSYTFAQYQGGAWQFGEVLIPEEVAQRTQRPLSEIQVDNHVLVAPSFSFERNGQAITDWQVATYEFRDEVGNRHHPSSNTVPNTNLDLRDPAWKLTGTVLRNEQAQFAPREVWKLSPLEIPDIRVGRVINETGQVQGIDLECLAIGGGRGPIFYNWPVSSGIETSTSYGARFEGQPTKVKLQRGPAGDKLTVDGKMPHIVVKHVELPDPRQALLVRATSPEGDLIKLSVVHPVKEYAVYFLDPKYTGKDIVLEFIIHESRPFELYVPPPPVPKQLETEYPVGPAEPGP